MNLRFGTFRHLTAMIVALLCCSACAPKPAGLTNSFGTPHTRMSELQSAFEDVDDGRIFVVAHRGCWSAAPENSLQAMRDCIHMGVEVAEIDVHLTREGELLVFHDQSLERMTDGAGLLREKSLDELRALRLYEWDGSPHQIMGRKLLTQHRIPTLREVFEVTRGRLMLNLEIKSNAEIGFVETFNAALALAREMGVENEVMWKIPSPAREYNIEIVPGFSGSLAPDTPADQITSALDIEGLRYVTPIIWRAQRPFDLQLEDFSNRGEIQAFEIVSDEPTYWPLMPDGRIEGADRNRYMAIAVLPRWSAGYSDDVALADPDAAWGRLIELGADLIMTDRPEQLIRYLEESGLR